MINYVQPTEEKECMCEDPHNAGKKLMLCGSAICKRLLDDFVPKPTLIMSEEVTDTEE